MTPLKVTEESFGKANTYFLLAWAVTAIVLITAYVDHRATQRELAITARKIELYSGLERLAADIARDLRSAIYLAPGYSSEAAGLDRLRRDRSEAIRLTRWLEQNFTRLTSALSSGERAEIRQPLTNLRALLLLNDASVDPNISPVGDAALLLAEHSAGSYLVPESITALRIEDAARYLWVASLDLHLWVPLLSRLKNAVENRIPLDGFAESLAEQEKAARADPGATMRNEAAAIWNNWLRSTSLSEVAAAALNPDQEVRRRRVITLAQTSQFLDQALQRRSELRVQAGGTASVVDLPAVPAKVQLRDAVLIAPWVLAFCFLAIVIYTSRALRYAPGPAQSAVEGEGEGAGDVGGAEIVGNMPAFYAFHGFSQRIGIVVAILLLILPSLLMGLVLPEFMTGIIENWRTEAPLFIAGIALSLLLALIAVGQFPRVQALID